MNISVMKQTTAGSLAGTMTFPEVVEELSAAGVESYHLDLIKMEKTFYLASGETFVEALNFDPPPISQEFSQSGVVAAIRAAQADEIRFPEFLRRVMLAGTSHYIAFLDGRQVVYFGRKGGFHVEKFPSSD